MAAGAMEKKTIEKFTPMHWILLTLLSGGLGAGGVQVAFNSQKDAEIVTELELKTALTQTVQSDILTQKIDKEIEDHPFVYEVRRDVKELKKQSIQDEENMRAIQQNIEQLMRRQNLEDEIVKPRRIPERELERRVEDD